MSINELFETNVSAATVSARGLTGTAQLTALASSIADNIIRTMEADIEVYRPRIQESARNNDEMDKLIDELGEVNPDDAEFLVQLDDATIDGILKSQQSKRSRAKSKSMTLDNYRKLMTAAIAENIVRIVTGRPKSAGGFRATAGIVNYTIEQLEALSADQNALRKEIRNIQSKKSIMKSKADFDESDERWQALLKAEQQLKDMRIGGSSTVVEVDTTKNALAEMLADKDISKMKSADAHELLEAISQMVTE
jgi:predicted component of type VI protein secretion system